MSVGDSTLLRVISTVERDVEEAFLGAIKPGTVVFDVGANIGWYSLLAARKVGPAGSVVAFEPNHANAETARRNAQANRLANMTVAEAAVSDHDGWANFDDFTSLMGRLSDEGGTRVELMALDTWARENGCAPDVVKVDVEGFERQVLEGARDILVTARPTLLLEMHGQDRTQPILTLLESLDYNVDCIDFDGPPRDAPWWVHLLATPRA